MLKDFKGIFICLHTKKEGSCRLDLHSFYDKVATSKRPPVVFVDRMKIMFERDILKQTYSHPENFQRSTASDLRNIYRSRLTIFKG